MAVEDSTATFFVVVKYILRQREELLASASALA
jgi:hypothetical protein